jgi:hypothetical protein
MKWMLIVFAVAALWFSTAAGYAASDDVRFCILLLIVVAVGLKTYASVGRRKFFWLGLFAVMVAEAYREGFYAPT